MTLRAPRPSALEDAGTLAESEPPATAVCANCAAPLGGEFCAACGQRRVRSRLRVRDVLHDWWGRVVDVDRGLLGTVVGLTRRPVETLRAYLDGRRIRYASPVRYYMTWFVVWALLWDSQTPTAELAQLDFYRVPDEERLALASRLHVLTRAVDFPFLLLVAALQGLAFRRARMNYAEHLVVALFTFGHAHALDAAAEAVLRACGVESFVPGLVVQIAGATWAGIVAGRLYDGGGGVRGPVVGVAMSFAATALVTFAWIVATNVWLALTYGGA